MESIATGTTMKTAFCLSTCIVFVLATPALGQEVDRTFEDTEAKGSWSGSLSIESDTTFERKRTQDTVEDSIDVSDFKLALAIETPPLIFGQGILFTSGASYSPFAFDNTDRESSLFVETKIGGTYLEPTVFRGGIFNPKEAGDFDDAFAASVAFRHAENFDGFFESDTGDAQTLSANIEYRDLLLQYCAVEKIDRPGIRLDACEDKEITGAFGFAINAGLSRTWASNPQKENKQVKAKAKLLFPLVAGRVTPSLAGYANRIWFDQPTTAGLPDREDWQYGIEGAFDITRLFPTHDWLKISVGAKQEWLDSNDPKQEAQQFSGFVSLKVAFGLF